LERGEKISRHAMNHSKTKQMYSFPKEKRFREKQKEHTEYLYEIPGTKETRTTSLGYGKKYDFVAEYLKKANKSPYYYFESSFKKFAEPRTKTPDFGVKSKQFYKKKF